MKYAMLFAQSFRFHLVQFKKYEGLSADAPRHCSHIFCSYHKRKQGIVNNELKIPCFCYMWQVAYPVRVSQLHEFISKHPLNYTL